MRSTFEPCESLCTVGSLHFVPAIHKVNLMEENGTHLDKSYNHKLICCTCGPGSVVGIATAYGLVGPGIESRWGEIFHTSPDRP